MENQYRTFKPCFAHGGAKIVSYPNHKGVSLVGEIIGPHPDNPGELHVNYVGRGHTTLKANGKLLVADIDTSLDINLIEIE